MSELFPHTCTHALSMGALVREAAITSDLSIIKKEAAITSALQKVVITSVLVQVAVRNNVDSPCTLYMYVCAYHSLTHSLTHSGWEAALGVTVGVVKVKNINTPL